MRINHPALLINLLLLPFFCNLKTGGPTGLINRLARKWLINSLCWNHFFIQQCLFPNLFISNRFFFTFFFIIIVLLLSWSLKISKNNYSPNDWFLIKFFIKIISLDSSQSVPPMSPCPPLVIIRVCPWLINHHVPNVFLWIYLFIPNVPHSFQPIDVSHIRICRVERPFIKGCLRGGPTR